MADRVERPESFFGFRLGDDYKMARWDRIAEYFYLLNQQSGNIRVVNLGPTTENNPFLMAIITSAENQARLEELREVNGRVADPRGLSDAEIDGLVQEGKVIVCQSMSLHANEIAATQMAPQLAYNLVTGEDEATKHILDNVIFLMVPCFNPDGQLMVTDWYNEHLGTDFEGCDLPWLYHRYCGHDNNRDAFMLNLVESKYMARIMFQDWHPHVFQDHHEMGGYQPRLFVCPYCEPIHPHADPLVWREINWYGAHMVYKLEEAGHQGVISGAMFPAWYHMGFHWLGNYHNIASLLSETARRNWPVPSTCIRISSGAKTGTPCTRCPITSRRRTFRIRGRGLVAAARHGGPAARRRQGNHGHRGPVSGNGSAECRAEGPASDPTGPGGRIGGFLHPPGPARSGGRGPPGECPAPPGRRRAAHPDPGDGGKPGLSRWHLVHFQCPAQARRGQDAAGTDLLAGRRLGAQGRRLAHEDLRHDDGHAGGDDGRPRGTGGSFPRRPGR